MRTADEVIDFISSHPECSGVIFDIDGVLAPFIREPGDACIPDIVRSDLRRVPAKYVVAGSVTGRQAENAEYVLNTPGFDVYGNLGAEHRRRNQHFIRTRLDFLLWRPWVRHVGLREWRRSLRALGVQLHDKGPVIEFSWRGAPDEDVACAAVQAAAARARACGLAVQFGKKQVEFRPPVHCDKGTAVRQLLRRYPQVRCAIYFGDDLVDVPAMKALEDMVACGRLDVAVRVGVRWPDTPPEVIAAANYVVEGTTGVQEVLHRLVA